MSLGTKLLKIRKHLNLTQPEIAQMLEVSQGTYCDWESDKYKPKFNNLLKIHTELGVNIDDLLDEDKKIILNKNENCHNSFNGYAENSSITINSKDVMELLAQIVEIQNAILKKIDK